MIDADRCIVPRHRALSASLALAILFLIGNIGCADAADDPMSRLLETIFPGSTTLGSSTDQTPIDMCFKPGAHQTCWRVPKTYLDFKPNWTGGIQDVILVSAALYWNNNAMPAASAGNTTAAAAGQPDDVVHITVSPSANPFTRGYLSNIVLSQMEQVGQDSEFTEYAYKRVNGERLADSAIFVPVTDFADGIYFDCARNSPQFGSKLLNCTASTDFRNNVFVKYIFNSRNLPRWREIDAKVRQLLTSLQTEP